MGQSIIANNELVFINSELSANRNPDLDIESKSIAVAKETGAHLINVQSNTATMGLANSSFKLFPND